MYHVIVNPASQSGKTLQLWEKLEGRMKERSIPYRRIRAESSAQMMEEVGRLTAPDAGAETVRLLVIGGDGTLDEVVDAIGDPQRVELGLIPSGSGNDFARDLKLDKDPVRLLDRITEGKVRRTLDLGTVEYLEYIRDEAAEDIGGRVFRPQGRFAVSAGMGFDAAVCEAAGKAPVKKILNRLGLGRLIYLFTAVRIIMKNRSCACELTIDGQETISLPRCLLVAFMNHRYEGGGFCFCPQADAGDGLLDLCVAGDVSRRKFFLALPFALVGKHYLFRGISHYRAGTVTIRSSRPLWIHTDGETQVRGTALKVSCAKQVLRLLE